MICRKSSAKGLRSSAQHRLQPTSTKKNATDGVDATAIVPFRYLFPLVFPVIHTLREFLAKGGDDEATIVAMQQAWLKSALLQLTLWSRPYVKDGDF